MLLINILVTNELVLIDSSTIQDTIPTVGEDNSVAVPNNDQLYIYGRDGGNGHPGWNPSKKY